MGSNVPGYIAPVMGGLSKCVKCVENFSVQRAVNDSRPARRAPTGAHSTPAAAPAIRHAPRVPGIPTLAPRASRGRALRALAEDLRRRTADRGTRYRTAAACVADSVAPPLRRPRRWLRPAAAKWRRYGRRVVNRDRRT